jgi:hypothetical protein
MEVWTNRIYSPQSVMVPYQFYPSTGVCKIDADTSPSPSQCSEVTFHNRFLPQHFTRTPSIPYLTQYVAARTLHVLTLTDLYIARSSHLRNMQNLCASTVTLNSWVRLIQTRVTQVYKPLMFFHRNNMLRFTRIQNSSQNRF